ncbi:nitroreductase family protein [Spartinivicinus poritis]|uniref:Putative NAD(P)H nitroreductase n=1 Tax=Spartinivicinus poritis TaxID=2994640 RepID=A0ABT5UDZ0_9GAMM|nr:nitroreductase [Spartinivicinus sp. A2-2]MDE1464590.1 nitroreductase [Spartinivicinus sp. A2-2]
MEILTALHNRVSKPRLVEPGPSDEQLAGIFQAALRAPDHAMLKPWRFLTIAGTGLEKLGQLFAEAAKQDQPDLSQEALNKYLGMPLRAPMIIVVICSPKPHLKVPEVEQILSTGAATQNMLLACHGMELGAMWRTGAMAYHTHVKAGLGIGTDELLAGFLYVGTPQGSTKRIPELNLTDFVQNWPLNKK